MLQFPSAETRKVRQKRLLRPWFPALGVRNRLVAPLYTLCSWIWQLWLAIWRPGTLTVVAVSLFKIYADSKVPIDIFLSRLPDIARSSFIVRIVQSHTVLIVCIIALAAFFLLVCRQANSAVNREKRLRALRVDYVVEHVGRLSPSDYLSAYRPDVDYIERQVDGESASADELIRTTLLSAASVPSTLISAIRGVLIVGSPAEGKTRTAWEGLFSNPKLRRSWFIRWPRNSVPLLFDYEAFSGQRVVVWLDDINLYANGSVAEIVKDLPRRFREAKVRSCVFIATCHEGNELLAAQGMLDDFTSSLREIRLGPISREQAQILAAELAAYSPNQTGPRFSESEYMSFWNQRSPGSMVFGIAHLPRRVKDLTDYPANILYTMQLLASAAIVLKENCVRATCDEVFGWPKDDDEGWIRARSELIQQGFITVAKTPAATFVPVADVYLDPKALPPSPIWDHDPSSQWPVLYRVFRQTSDAESLISLGNALYGRPWRGRNLSDVRMEMLYARRCYRVALGIYDDEPGSAEQASSLDLFATALFAAASLYRSRVNIRLRLLEEARPYAFRARDAYRYLQQASGDSLYQHLAERAENLIADIDEAREFELETDDEDSALPYEGADGV